MGTPEQRRSVRAMFNRWNADLTRLQKLFGAYDENDFSDGAEMQRNLGSAIEAARGLLASTAQK